MLYISFQSDGHKLAVTVTVTVTVTDYAPIHAFQELTGLTMWASKRPTWVKPFGVQICSMLLK